ncbi:MAG: hypothetical protein Q7S99_03195 [Parvibaculum sp.]|nr:hypothetical protein [Parvibaculum sp.]
MTFMFSTQALVAAIFIGLGLLAVYLLRRDHKRSVAFSESFGAVNNGIDEEDFDAFLRRMHGGDSDNGLHGMETPTATVPTEKHKPCPCGDGGGVHCSHDGCPYPPAVKHQSPRKPRAKKPRPAGKKPAKASAAKPKPRAAAAKKPVTKKPASKKKAAKK